MKSAVAATFLVSASAALAQTLTINTPTALVECEPAQIAFSGGTAPYDISVLPGGQVSAAPLEQFPQQSTTTYTWTVDIASGTSVTMELRDSTGALAYSQAVTIQQGTTTSCVGKSGGSSAGGSSGAGGASSSGSAPSSAASSGTAPTSAAGGASSGAASGGNSPTTSGTQPATTSSKSNGASGMQVGFSGVALAAAGALLRAAF